MEFRYKVLLAEDDDSIKLQIAAVLEMNDYEMIHAATGHDTLQMAKSHCPDLILLDLGLPDMDGMEVLETLRCWSAIPVIVVSARASEEEKVKALETGADDYIVKPHQNNELIARIRVALRHMRCQNQSSLRRDELIKVGDMSVDLENHTISINGEPVELTQNEYRIVALLSQNIGHIMPYDKLLTRLWGPNSTGNNQILRVNMANIRRKIEKDPAHPRYIITENGIGYRMPSPEQLAPETI